jgi:histone H3/H4
MHEDLNAFRRCSTCKAPIAFRAKYFTCSVSTCNRARTGLFFCSLPCWEAHVPEARHRDAWAEVQTAPTQEAWQLERAERAEAEARSLAPAPAARHAPKTAPAHPPKAANAPEQAVDRDVLVVLSKLKAYVRARSEMNTSDRVTEVLSNHLRKLANQATAHAAADGRTTVMDRDMIPVVRRWR